MIQTAQEEEDIPGCCVRGEFTMEDWSWYYRSAADRTGEWSAGEYKVMTTGQSPVR